MHRQVDGNGRARRSLHRGRTGHDLSHQLRRPGTVRRSASGHARPVRTRLRWVPDSCASIRPPACRACSAAAWLGSKSKPRRPWRCIAAGSRTSWLSRFRRPATSAASSPARCRCKSRAVVNEEVVRKVPGAGLRIVQEEQVRRVPVTTYRQVTERVQQQTPVQVCKMTEEEVVRRHSGHHHADGDGRAGGADSGASLQDRGG